MITRPCLNFKGGLVKPPLTLGHVWVSIHIPLVNVDVFIYKFTNPDIDLANLWGHFY